MLGEPSSPAAVRACSRAALASRLAHLTDELEVESAARYLDALEALGCEVDAWDTTYYQVLPGEDPVLQWTKGAVMRPFLTALDEAEAAGVLRRLRGAPS